MSPVVSRRLATPGELALAAVPVFLVSGGLYLATLLPDVGLWDTAEFQAVGPVLGTAHPTGYPTYTLLLWLASVVLQPFGNEAYRADLLSALLMAGAAALLATRVVMATRRPALGLVSGLVFALTPVAWTWALRADPHALHAFAAALLLVLLGAWQGREEALPGSGRRWLLLAALVFGLALGNHALTLLLAPGMAAYVLLVSPRILWRQWRLVLACAGLMALTTIAVYLYLPLRAGMDPPLAYAQPQTWDGFWYVVLGEQFQGSYALPAAGQLLSGMWGELVRDLGPLAIVAVAGAILGLVRHPRLTVLGLLWFGSTWLFAVGYPNAAIERYFLVPLLVAALWVALAADAVWDILHDLLQRPGRATAYQLAAAALVLLLVAAAVVPAIGRYAAIDASEDRWGRQVVEATFAAVEPDAVIVSWWSFSTPLWYAQHVEGQRPDVTVIDDRDVIDDGYGNVSGVIETHLGQRPVYLIRLSDDLARLAQRYRLEPVPGVPLELYRVLGRAEGGAEASSLPLGWSGA